jgi:hypothetical protein
MTSEIGFILRELVCLKLIKPSRSMKSLGIIGELQLSGVVFTSLFIVSKDEMEKLLGRVGGIVVLFTLLHAAVFLSL